MTGRAGGPAPAAARGLTAQAAAEGLGLGFRVWGLGDLPGMVYQLNTRMAVDEAGVNWGRPRKMYLGEGGGSEGRCAGGGRGGQRAFAAGSGGSGRQPAPPLP